MSINEIAMKQFVIFFISAFMCLTTYGQNTYSGKIIGTPNPCQTDPCLPGVVLGLETISNIYVLTINSNWIWSNNKLIVEDIEYFLDDEVEITGTITTKQDINSNEYIELEIETIKKLTSSNIETLSSDNNKVYFDATNKIITIDETLQNQSFTFELINMQGKVVCRKTNTENSSIGAANLPKGIYLYRLLQNGQAIHSGKLMLK